MNDSELNQLLESVKVPEQSSEYWQDFPGQVARSLSRQRATEVRSWLPYRRPALAWGMALATCLVIGFFVGHWRGANRVNALLQNGKMLREVVAMFPNQVQAIIQDETGLHISLAETPNVPQSQPLWIKVCEGTHCRSIVTFSGQAVQIDGQRVEVLADASGGVMLVGERFFWSSKENLIRDHLRIDARQLGQIL
jgi:hypothetical protein